MIVEGICQLLLISWELVISGRWKETFDFFEEKEKPIYLKFFFGLNLKISLVVLVKNCLKNLSLLQDFKFKVRQFEKFSLGRWICGLKEETPLFKGPLWGRARPLQNSGTIKSIFHPSISFTHKFLLDSFGNPFVRSKEVLV